MKIEETAQGNYELKIKGREIFLTPSEFDALETEIKKIRLMPKMITCLKEDGYDINAIKADKSVLNELIEEFINAVDCAVDEEMLENYEYMFGQLMSEFEDEFEDLLEPYEHR